MARSKRLQIPIPDKGMKLIEMAALAEKLKTTTWARQVLEKAAEKVIKSKEAK